MRASCAGPCSPAKTPADRRMLALVLAQAGGLICICGTVAGAMLPLLFRRLEIDPGVAYSPLVAAFVDVTGTIVYFNVAGAWLL